MLLLSIPMMIYLKGGMPDYTGRMDIQNKVVL